MIAKPTSNIQTIARAAVFTFVAIGGMAGGLGLSTYTVAKANDMVLASVSGDAINNSQPAACYMK